MNNYTTIRYQQRPCVRCIYITTKLDVKTKKAYCRDSKAFVSAVRGTCDQFSKKNNKIIERMAKDRHRSSWALALDTYSRARLINCMNQASWL